MLLDGVRYVFRQGWNYWYIGNLTARKGGFEAHRETHDTAAYNAREASIIELLHEGYFVVRELFAFPPSLSLFLSVS